MREEISNSALNSVSPDFMADFWHLLCRGTQRTGTALWLQSTLNGCSLSSQSPSYKSSIRALVMYSPINILLVFIPLSFALYYTVDLHHQNVVLFVFSALGIIPLAGLLGLATEQVSVKTNDAVGGLVNASMGNVVELIVAAIGLRDVRCCRLSSPHVRVWLTSSCVVRHLPCPKHPAWGSSE